MSELKKCPFCGGEAALVSNPFDDEYTVCCKNKKCIAFYIGYDDAGLYNSKEEAITAWNTRVGEAGADNG